MSSSSWSRGAEKKNKDFEDIKNPWEIHSECCEYAQMSFVLRKVGGNLVFLGKESIFPRVRIAGTFFILSSLIRQFKLRVERRVADPRCERAELEMIGRPVPR